MSAKKLSAKITRQNQLTIPNEIINFLSLQEGDTLNFTILDDSTVLIKKSAMSSQGNQAALNFSMLPWMLEEIEDDYDEIPVS